MGASLADALTARTAVENRLIEAEAAHHATRLRAEADLAAATQRLARREQELSDAMAVVIAARTAVETGLAETEAAHRDAQQRAAADLTAAAERHAALEESARSRDQCGDDARRAVGCRRDCSTRTPSTSMRRTCRRSPAVSRISRRSTTCRSSGPDHSTGNCVMPPRRSSKPDATGSSK